jgi:hypothetical protein
MGERVPSDVDLIKPQRLEGTAESMFSYDSFGDTVAGRDAADWIRGIGYPTVVSEIRRGTQVWIYRNAEDDVVGFGSLGLASWKFGPRPQTVQLIPMLAVVAKYHGLPAVGSGSPKYCYQLLEHLLKQAEFNLAISPWPAMSVRPDNIKSIRLCQKAGFEWVKTVKAASRMLLCLG